MADTYPHHTIAPHTYNDAHKGQAEIRQARTALRDEAEKFMRLRSDFEDAYRKAKHRVIGKVGGKNADEREAAANLHELDAVVAEKVASKLAKAGWMQGWKPANIGDLRWLRDRADDAARSFSKKADDAIEDQRDYRKLMDKADRELELSPSMRGAA